jgi:hypothetical protein
MSLYASDAVPTHRLTVSLDLDFKTPPHDEIESAMREALEVILGLTRLVSLGILTDDPMATIVELPGAVPS